MPKRMSVQAYAILLDIEIDASESPRDFCVLLAGGPGVVELAWETYGWKARETRVWWSRRKDSAETWAFWKEADNVRRDKKLNIQWVDVHVSLVNLPDLSDEETSEDLEGDELQSGEGSESEGGYEDSEEEPGFTVIIHRAEFAVYSL